MQGYVDSFFSWSNTSHFIHQKFILKDQWTCHWAQFWFVTQNSETIGRKVLWIYSSVIRSEFSQDEFSSSTICTHVLAQANQSASQGKSFQNSYQLYYLEHFLFYVVLWKEKKTHLALCTWTVAQELIDLFDKTATAKNKEDFCCLYTESYYLMMEIIDTKEPDPVSTENKKLLYQRWVNPLPSLLFSWFFCSVKKLNLSEIYLLECPSSFTFNTGTSKAIPSSTRFL